MLTAKGLSEKAALTQQFLVLIRAEYEALKEEIVPLEPEAELAADMGPSPRGGNVKCHNWLGLREMASW